MDLGNLDGELCARTRETKRLGFKNGREWLRSMLLARLSTRPDYKRIAISERLSYRSHCHGIFHELLLTINPTTEASLADLLAQIVCQRIYNIYLNENNKSRVLCCTLLKAMKATPTIQRLKRFLCEPRDFQDSVVPCVAETVKFLENIEKQHTNR